MLISSVSGSACK